MLHCMAMVQVHLEGNGVNCYPTCEYVSLKSVQVMRLVSPHVVQTGLMVGVISSISVIIGMPIMRYYSIWRYNFTGCFYKVNAIIYQVDKRWFNG